MSTDHSGAGNRARPATAPTTRAGTEGRGDPVELARRLAPRVRERADEIERERRLPADLVAELRDGGLFHLMLPRSFGGGEHDPSTACRAIEEISAADGSAGWCLMLAAQSAMFAGYLPEADARAIFGNGGIVAGVARPIGRALRTDSPADGFMVSGRWPFASGSSHATWFAAECTVHDEPDSPRLDADGNAVTRVTFVPREAVTIHDTWHTTGLRGTASNDFSVDGAFVPASRGFQMIVDPPIHPAPLYQAPPLTFMTHGSHALGVARGALAAAGEILRTKRGWGDQPLSAQPRLQLVFAEATALVESARVFIYRAADDLWQAVTSGERDLARPSARLRLATSHAASASVRAVDLVHAAVGTTAIFTGSPLERQFRDIHTAAAHVMIGPLTYEAAGRVELGLEADFPFF